MDYLPPDRIHPQQESVPYRKSGSFRAHSDEPADACCMYKQHSPVHLYEPLQRAHLWIALSRILQKRDIQGTGQGSVNRYKEVCFLYSLVLGFSSKYQVVSIERSQKFSILVTQYCLSI